MIKDHDVGKAVVSTEVIKMGMRIDNGDGQVGDLPHHCRNISDAAARINQNGMIIPEQQVNNRMFIVARLRQGVEPICDLLDLKPFIVRFGGVRN